MALEVIPRTNIVFDSECDDVTAGFAWFLLIKFLIQAGLNKQYEKCKIGDD